MRNVLMAAALLWAPVAQAADVWMWGLGPKVGTVVLPGRMPISFPKKVKEDDYLEKVGGDISVGVNGVYYANSRSRLGATAGFDLGKRFYDANFVLLYNVAVSADAVDFLFGGGVGAGYMRWGGAGESRLGVSYFPFRAETSVLVRDQWRGYQLTAFFNLDIPSSQRYLNEGGLDTEVSWMVYPTFGLELSVMFGDFTPPRPRKK